MAPPRFVLGLCNMLQSFGIRYLTPEHFRLAKLNDGSVLFEFWNTLHDLIVAILVDFQLDSQTLEAAWSQRQQDNRLEMCQEISRHYLYQWGYLSVAFYDSEMKSSRELLIAFSWLVSRSNLHQRSREISSQLYLPPFPTQMPLINDQECDTTRTSNVELEFHQKLRSESHTGDWETRLEHLHLVLGKLRSAFCELNALEMSEGKYLERIRMRQNPSERAEWEKTDAPDGTLSPYEIQLLKTPELLQKHYIALQRRIEDYEDEETFYKWMGSVVNATKEKKSTSGIPILRDNDSTEEPEPIPLEFQSSYAQVEQIQQLIERLKPLRAIVNKEWKDAKAAVSDSEYRRNKHKLAKIAAKCDTKFPTIHDEYVKAAVRSEKEWIRTAMHRPEQLPEEIPDEGGCSAEEYQQQREALALRIQMEFEKMGIEFV